MCLRVDMFVYILQKNPAACSVEWSTAITFSMMIRASSIAQQDALACKEQCLFLAVRCWKINFKFEVNKQTCNVRVQGSAKSTSRHRRLCVGTEYSIWNGYKNTFAFSSEKQKGKIDKKTHLIIPI